MAYSGTMEFHPCTVALLSDTTLAGAAWLRYRMFEELDLEADYRSGADDFMERCRDWYATHLDDPRHLTLVACGSDGTALGMASLGIEDRPPHPFLEPNRYGFLSGLYVVPELRGRGVGTALVQAVHGEAQKRRVSRIDLLANPASRELYLRLGYRVRDNGLMFRLEPGRPPTGG